jgi:hypothetical protein
MSGTWNLPVTIDNRYEDTPAVDRGILQHRADAASMGDWDGGGDEIPFEDCCSVAVCSPERVRDLIA